MIRKSTASRDTHCFCESQHKQKLAFNIESQGLHMCVFLRVCVTRLELNTYLYTEFGDPI